MAKKRKRSGSKRPPWEKPAPERARKTKLSKSAKAQAKTRATKAGRKYPNLVDNMRAASRSKRGRRKRSAK